MTDSRDIVLDAATSFDGGFCIGHARVTGHFRDRASVSADHGIARGDSGGLVIR